MTMYAQNGIMQIAVGEGHGGCGQLHKREEGERFFAVTCEKCENFLRTDPLWAATIEDIPESYDERLQRERLEKNQARYQHSITEQASALLALLAGPADLLAGITPALAPAVPPCRKCSASVAPGSRFCGGCGTPLLHEVTSGAA